MNHIPAFIISLYEIVTRLKQRIHHFFLPRKQKQDICVFCIGYAKTGTSSLSEALTLLGYRSVHWFRAGKEPKKGWISCIRQCRYDAFADMPIIKRGFFKQLDKEFPRSKFILTLRDTDSLLQSWENYFKGSHLAINSEEMRQKVKTYYERHNKEILKYFKDKPSKLLIMDIFKGDGWEKLCPFLDKPLPNQSFPHKRKGKYTLHRFVPFQLH